MGFIVNYNSYEESVSSVAESCLNLRPRGPQGIRLKKQIKCHIFSQKLKFTGWVMVMRQHQYSGVIKSLTLSQITCKHARLPQFSFIQFRPLSRV